MSTQAVAKQAINPANTTEEQTMFRVLAAVSFCHVLNDMMQSLLPAIYPILKTSFHLNFTQIGFITLTFQITASLLQPVIGHYTDRQPMPYSLPIAMPFTLVSTGVLRAHPCQPLVQGSTRSASQQTRKTRGRIRRIAAATGDHSNLRLNRPHLLEVLLPRRPPQLLPLLPHREVSCLRSEF